LKILLDAGLVEAERHGREMLYRLDCQVLSRALRGMADALELCQASCCQPGRCETTCTPQIGEHDDDTDSDDPS
jgi:hypothetical protein